jgi:hypothetical protein
MHVHFLHPDAEMQASRHSRMSLGILSWKILGLGEALNWLQQYSKMVGCVSIIAFDNYLLYLCICTGLRLVYTSIHVSSSKSQGDMEGRVTVQVAYTYKILPSILILDVML